MRQVELSVYINKHEGTGEYHLTAEEFRFGQPTSLVHHATLPKEATQWDAHDAAIKIAEERERLFRLPAYILDRSHVPALRLSLAVFRKQTLAARAAWEKRAVEEGKKS